MVSKNNFKFIKLLLFAITEYEIYTIEMWDKWYVQPWSSV